MPSPSGLIGSCLPRALRLLDLVFPAVGVASLLSSAALYYLHECFLVAGIGSVRVHTLLFKNSFFHCPMSMPAALRSGIRLFVQLGRVVEISRNFFSLVPQSPGARGIVGYELSAMSAGVLSITSDHQVAKG